jgi:GH15 family glucan-1,4-alpha-glucosidase
MSLIEDYALIGDCETAALVGRDGSIDWLCWPRFDSGALFAALLGDSNHGRWLIAPCDIRSARIRRSYMPQTLILQTDFETADGTARIIDFMPVRQDHSRLVRIVEGLRGNLKMFMELVMRFDYGSIVPWVTRLEDRSGIRAIAGPHMVVLRSPVHLEGRSHTTVSEFTLHEGERFRFVLCYGPSHLDIPPPVNADSVLEETIDQWRSWSSQSKYRGEWSEAVERSLITLKALTYQPTGGIVAAPTASIPERLGGVRNWDYRYCWLRDSTLTLLALMNAGYFEEARAWRNWLQRVAAGSPESIQIMYGLAGERRLLEWEADWLPGYEGARPVRIGNAAAQQLQLDVYGELMDTLYQGRIGGLAPTETAWSLQRVLTEHLTTVWNKTDHGIWEIRGEPRHFTYSKVMAWVALDRAIRTIESGAATGPLQQWREVREKIHADVCAHGYDERIGTFVQSYGSRELDASLLLIPLTGFLPSSDPRVHRTVAAIESQLHCDGLILRYNSSRVEDGLPPSEGAFLACSFWLVDNYILQNRWTEARALFNRLLSLRNDVGLLAEEYDIEAKRQVGNFPQAFSHIALINTAFNFTKASGPSVQRAASTKKS